VYQKSSVTCLVLHVNPDTSKGRKRALLASRGIAALPREEIIEKGPRACEGEECNTVRARHASSERRAKGRSSSTEAVALAHTWVSLDRQCRRNRCVNQTGR